MLVYVRVNTDQNPCHRYQCNTVNTYKQNWSTPPPPPPPPPASAALR